MSHKIAVITGASRGIGRTVALTFAKKGYQTAICCKTNSAGLEEVKKEILSYGQDCLAMTIDVGDFPSCQKFFHEVVHRFGSVDILINNAGISYIGLFQDMSPDEWNTILSTNLSSVFHCCKLAIPEMLKQGGGKIINMSSVWGNTGASCEAAYSATKGGINALTKALGKELAPSRITVNAIACGVIDTEMNHFLSHEEKKQLEEEIPAGRFGQPEEVAGLALFLAESNDYLTGQVITLDGGWQ